MLFNLTLLEWKVTVNNFCQKVLILGENSLDFVRYETLALRYVFGHRRDAIQWILLLSIIIVIINFNADALSGGSDDISNFGLGLIWTIVSVSFAIGYLILMELAVK